MPGCGRDACPLMHTRAAPIGTDTDLVYMRSALLVVLAGLLWSMGGVLVRLVEERRP